MIALSINDNAVAAQRAVLFRNIFAYGIQKATHIRGNANPHRLFIKGRMTNTAGDPLRILKESVLRNLHHFVIIFDSAVLS